MKHSCRVTIQRTMKNPPLEKGGWGDFQVKQLLFFIGCVVLVASLMALPAFAAVKIGIIDIQKVLREAKAAKSVQDAFLKDVNAKKATLAERQKKISQMDKELKSAGKKLSAAERKEKNEKLAKEIKEFKRQGSDFDEELKKKNVEMARRLIGEIRDVAKTLANDENYTVILEKGAAAVVAADDAADVTDKIIGLYDARNK